MTLRFIDVDPDTGTANSPTVWVEDEAGEILVQGWNPGPELLAQIEANPAPGHQPGSPDGEAVVRIPFRMIPALRKACDVADNLR